MAAIDRVADSFLAVDTDTGRIVDANPAAGSLLGLARDALLGVDALSFVPELQREGWWTELDAMTEGAEPRCFASSLCDASGREIPVDCSVTCFATRNRTLALVLARPR
jgi:PAS domain S-box-containing protein